MRSIFLIAWKDVKQIILNPMFLLICAICTVIWSVLYVNLLKQFATHGMMAGLQGGQGPNIIRGVFMQHVQITNLIFLFVVPAITMRLIAEEKKSRTYDLLLTSPISATHISVGKFLAGLGATATLLLISFLYPVATSFIADFSWSNVIAIYFGMFFMASLYTASGLFASSLTESPMLAVFMGLAFNLLIWFVGPSGANSDVKWLAEVMEYVSVGSQMMTFVNGELQTSAIIFFITLIGFFVFLSQRVVESSRWR